MDITFHYPPEVTELLVTAVPLLCRSKKGVLLFFQGAGVPATHRADLEARVSQSPDKIGKHEITRTIIARINEMGEPGLRVRREVIKRVSEFEDFSSCWPNDELKAKGAVADIQRVVNVKDSFTRINKERQTEREARISQADVKVAEAQSKKAAIESVYAGLGRLFNEKDAQKKGKALEGVLNQFFRVHGVLVREAFTLRGVAGDGVIEQIDGVIEFEGSVYLAEMKWTKSPLGPGEVAQHLVRVFSRADARGLFISASGYTPAALASCKESLQKSVFALCTLQEFVFLLERQLDLKQFLKTKITAAILDKNPLYDPIQAGELGP